MSILIWSALHLWYIPIKISFNIQRFKLNAEREQLKRKLDKLQDENNYKITSRSIYQKPM